MSTNKVHQQLERAPKELRKYVEALQENLQILQDQLRKAQERITHLEPFEPRNYQLLEENEQLKKALAEATSKRAASARKNKNKDKKGRKGGEP